MSVGASGGAAGELWRPVVGYEGLYEVSNLGGVRSLDRIVSRGNQTLRLKGAIKNPAEDSYGYLQARLTKDGKGKLVLVHRLIAMAFIENPESLPEVNHLDLDKKNNAALNLEWSLHSDNMKHAGDRGRLCGYMNKNKRIKLCPASVAGIREASRLGGTHRGIASSFGVSSTTVGNIVNHQRWNPEIIDLAPRLIAEGKSLSSQGASHATQ